LSGPVQERQGDARVNHSSPRGSENGRTGVVTIIWPNLKLGGPACLCVDFLSRVFFATAMFARSGADT
jgi:hypothetical protein